jgi:hypothetical protein
MNEDGVVVEVNQSWDPDDELHQDFWYRVGRRDGDRINWPSSGTRFTNG